MDQPKLHAECVPIPTNLAWPCMRDSKTGMEWFENLNVKWDHNIKHNIYTATVASYIRS